MASAAKDHLALDRAILLWSETNEKPNNRAYAAICDALSAIRRNDTEAVSVAITEISKRKSYAYITGINLVIQATHTSDAAAFAAGMKKMLSSFRRYMFGEEFDGLIDPFAIGIYELAKAYAPSAVEEFDTTRRLPWDAEYHQWLSGVEDVQDLYELPELPNLIEEAMTNTNPMPWAKQIRETW